MPTRNINLTEHQQTVIDDLVKSGRYQDADEVLRDGVQLLEQREIRDSAKLSILREAVERGFADLDNGPVC